MKDEEILKEILAEFQYAKTKFAPFNNSHEGYAVIKEELDELWDEIKNNKFPTSSMRNQREEAIQVAAMAIRFIKMLDKKNRP